MLICEYSNSKGYFIEPTIIQSKDPTEKIMKEEIFGPILSIYVYKDSDVDKTLKLVDSTTPFALTGAVFAQDELVFHQCILWDLCFKMNVCYRKFLKRAVDELKMTAGNFYVNDKSTGSVVGQQPFGGGRMSGDY